MAISCSPSIGGRTAAALQAVLDGAAAAGAATELVQAAEHRDLTEVVARMADADAFVLGAPMYRASYASPFKALLDGTPREALTGRAVAIVATAGSDHHFLGLQAMRGVLVDFFAAHVVSPGLYVNADSYTPDQTLTAERADQARTQGIALVELARAIASSEGLRSVIPNA
ncbi:NAD(P)H-dependent oxidoreductase [Amycolatopsis sp. NPDC004079]|uniref:NADPH-dependent FMN reductase n=1 Tax=Amycolatopsis sp. NPDC004079 TaxID=3154549 RepID=UPI0033BC6D97